MRLFWPASIYLLGIIPVLIGCYLAMIRRRHRFAVRYASLALVRPALPRRWRRVRHLPFALFLLALTSLVIACARPYAVGLIPSDQTVIILALDVSRSMCSADIQPNRLQAAEKAALDFIHRQKATTQVGVIAFSGFAELIQSPTADPERLQSAIESLMLGSTTAIGSGILRSLDAIAEVDPGVSPSQEVGSAMQADEQPAYPPPAGDMSSADENPPRPDIIILLTDGVSNTGPEPLDAARQAAERGVRVYTIGYGTPQGNLYPDCPSNLVGSDPTRSFVSASVDSYHRQNGVGGLFRDQEQNFRPLEGGTTGGSSGYPRGIDEETLKKVSRLTGGAYYTAESAGELHKVFQELSSLPITRRAEREISVAFAALRAFLAALAVVLSHLWRPV